MRQGRKFLSLAIAMTFLAIAAMPLATPHAALAAGKSAAANGSTKSRNTLRQFTGYVSSVDKTTLTVEKRGKKPQSRVFAKHDALRTTGGDIEKNAHVTVYYREDGGRSVAHRVVVKQDEDDDSTKDR